MYENSFIEVYSLLSHCNLRQVLPLKLSVLGDKFDDKVCSVLQLQLNDLDKLTLQTEANSLDTNLTINALYYWNLLKCPKIIATMLKRNDTNSLMGFSGRHIAEIETDLSTKVLSLSTAQTTTNRENKLRQQPLDRCNYLKTQHHVVPGISWGSLSSDLQK